MRAIAIVTSVVAIVCAGIGVYFFSQLNDFQNSILNAAFRGEISTLEAEILAGHDVNFQDVHGNSAVNLAVRQGNIELLEYLLKHGASASVGMPPALSLAYSNGDIAAVKLLIQNGANVDQADRSGSTPFVHAICSGMVTVEDIDLLVANGADFQIQDRDGWQPIHHLLLSVNLDESSKLERLKVIADAGCSLTVDNSRNLERLRNRDSMRDATQFTLALGATPLEIAEKNNMQLIAKYLRLRLQAAEGVD